MSARGTEGSQRLLAAVAGELEAQLPTLNAELAAELGAEISDLVADDALRDLLVASVSANVSTVLGVLAHRIPLEHADAPAVATAQTRRLAQREVPMAALLRAYRLGEARFVQWWLRALAGHSLDPETLAASAQEANAVTARYVDQVCEQLVEIYRTERKRWTQRDWPVRAADVRAVLDSPRVDTGAAEAMLNCPLDGPHVAAILWVGDAAAAAHGPEDVERGADLLARASTRRPLTVPADEHTLWAWVSGPEPMLVDESALAASLRGRGLHAALGEPAPGLTGFRSSHREARKAQGVAQRCPDPARPVTRFDRVSIPALLSEDLDVLRGWVARTLGGLARDDEAMARLRETLRTFLETGGSYTDAAARLHLHKNTVHYRVRKAETVRGYPLAQQRLDVEVALVICDRLGRAVLS